jgi:tetratricopeptide (TPR) repeat protein
MLIPGQLRRDIIQTLLDTYDYWGLARFVRFCFSRDLTSITPLQTNLTDVVDALLTWAEQQGQVAQLLAAAKEERENRPEFNDLLTRLHRVPGAVPLPKASVLPLPGRLPPGSKMPFPRNPHFTGRQGDLLVLAGWLLGLGPQTANGGPRSGPKGEQLPKSAYGPQAVAVTQAVTVGIGGIGKTQLAVEFAYRYGRYFSGVHWLDAAGNLDAEVAACGRAMQNQLPRWPEKQPDQVAVTLDYWQLNPGRLVILDNAGNPAGLRKWLVRLDSLPLLVTSRRGNWNQMGITTHRLDELSRSESTALLTRLAPQLAQDPVLAQVAARLHDFPLALDLAGHYLADRQGLSAADFLKELDMAQLLEHPALVDWIQAQDNPTGHPTSLVRTFALSWARLDPAKPTEALARRLFLAMGYCAPDVPVPTAVLYRVSEKTYLETNISTREVDKARRRLAYLGLTTPAAEGPALHPLMSEFSQMEDKNATLATIADILGTVTYEALDSGLPQNFQPYRAHLENTAKFSAKAKNENAGLLFSHLGSHLHMIADFEGAKKALTWALAIDEAVYGHNHPIVATDVNNLGGVLLEMGDPVEAREAFARALAIDKAVYGPNHPIVAIRVNNLGMVLKEMGDPVGARRAFSRALAIDEAVYGPDHPKVAIRVNNLGGILQELGDPDGARKAYEWALEIWQASFGDEHPQVATAYNNLGLVLNELGDLVGARMAYERALAIDEAVYGPDHPKAATDVNNLGLVLHKMGDLTGARAAYERALTIVEKVYNPNHPNAAKYINNLGYLCWDEGDLVSARNHIKRALNIREQLFGPEHPSTQKSYYYLAAIEQEINSQ